MDMMEFAQSVMTWSLFGGLLGGLIAVIYVISKKKRSDKNKKTQ